MEICYNGKNYKGWQIQKDVISVQEILNKTLKRLFANQPIKTIGSSRTDAGVHALRLSVSCLVPETPCIPDEKIFIALNSMLPNDITVKMLKTMNPPIHARFDALGKAYTYVINRGAPTPFNGNYCWHVKNCNNLKTLREAADYLTGTHDFASFTVHSHLAEDTTRTIYRIDIEEFGEYLCLSFIGNGFLYKMIRSLVGTLVPVGCGNLSPKKVKEILQAKNRAKALNTAPPQALFLMKVFYEKDGDPCQFKLKDLPYQY